MMTVMIKTTATATKSIWLYPSGSPGTVSLHLSVETPMIEPEYKVKLLATPAFDITYSLTRFAPVIKAANSPAKKIKNKKLI